MWSLGSLSRLGLSSWGRGKGEMDYVVVGVSVGGMAFEEVEYVVGD
jgi:hypothetical protein